MFKIWARTTKGDKITRDLLYKNFDRFEPDSLLDYVIEICHEIDIPTPVILRNHRDNLTRYNIARFKESDFVESIDFDNFILEYVKE